MMQSHESYSAVGLGNEFTDKIVEMVRDAGHANGVFTGQEFPEVAMAALFVFLVMDKEGKNTVKEIYALQKELKRKAIFFQWQQSRSL